MSNRITTSAWQLSPAARALRDDVDSLLGQNPPATVETLAALKALNNRPASVRNKCRSTPGDQGGGEWVFRTGDQSANVSADSLSGLWAAPDSDPTGASGAWQRQFGGDPNGPWFGTKGNGATYDTAAINAACATVAAQNYRVLNLPPTGAPYLIDDSITTGSVKLKGAGIFVLMDEDATISQWAQYGTWIQPTHATNPGVLASGNGVVVEGINFIYDQPVPGDAPWAPTTYGPAIRVTGTSAQIDNVRILNASHGIHWDYTGTAGGTNCRMTNTMIGAFVEGVKVTNVNDVMYWTSVEQRLLWYRTNTKVVDYIRANRVGGAIGYCDNLVVKGYQDFQSGRAFQFTDGTVLDATHSLYNATLSGVQFNLNTIALDTQTATVLARFTDVLLQSYTNFDGITSTDTLLQLGDNADISIATLTVNDAGGSIATVGAGGGGRLHIGTLDVRNFSSAVAGQTGIVANAGAIVTVDNIRRWNKTAGSGARYGGAGTFRTRQTISIFDYFSGLPDTTLTGATNWADVSTGIGCAPLTHGFVQARVYGSIDVTTSQVGGSLALRFAGQTTVTATGIAATATGYQSFDAGWIDLADTSATTMGRLQIAGTNGVVVQDAEVFLELR